MIWRALTAAWMFILSGMVFPAWANVLENVRVWPAPSETRVVMDLESEPAYSYFTLTKPDRLVFDLKKTGLGATLPVVVKDSSILTKIRKSSAPEAGTYRLVFELKDNSNPRIFTLAPGGEYGHRLVIDLPHKAAVAKPAKKKTKSTTSAALPFGTDDIVVALDPGHGGNDPGAVGPRRKYEKHVTLTIARQVAAKINAVPGMKAVLTRNGDYFVDLNKRSEIARKQGAHLLVSIHADGFHKPEPRGGSVWVLSRRRANSEIGRWIEKHEEQSNLLGGGALLGNNSEDEYLSRAVLDLQFSNSQKEGYDVAERILKEMGKVTRLHKSSPEHASLAVLKSPDIPSLLVEAGFITNPHEEKLLHTKSHQKKISNAVFLGIQTYFEDFPPDGTLMAAKKNGIKHKVTSGQSLSLIAKKYGSSVKAIKTANGLKSNSLRIGQILSVPEVNVAALAKTKPAASKKVATSKPAVSSSGKTATHTVARGEYLGKIAAKYGVTTASIRKANKLRSDELAIGQKLKITGIKPVDTKHKVLRGEYLGKIASNYGVSVDSIRRANKLRSDELAIGQTLIIPGS